MSTISDKMYTYLSSVIETNFSNLPGISKERQLEIICQFLIIEELRNLNRINTKQQVNPINVELGTISLPKDETDKHVILEINNLDIDQVSTEDNKQKSKKVKK